jgi:ribosomal protein S18 acetylase RimI-like enzyme
VEVPVLVRPATPEDLEVVGRITVDAYVAAHQLEDGPHGAYGRVLDDAASRLHEAVLLVAVRRGAIEGTVTICPEGSRFREIAHEGEVEFRFLAVAPSAWGSGVGSALIEACQAHAREVGAHRTVMCVRDTNASAMSMYVKHGFTRLPGRDLQPVPGVVLLALEKVL